MCCYFRKVLVIKDVKHKRGRASTFFVKIAWFHSTKFFRRGKLRCFRKLLVPKNVRDKRGRATTFFCRIFLVSQYQKHCRAIFRCLQHFLLSNYSKGRRGGGSENFPSNKFCLTVPKHSVTEPFRASYIF